MLRAPFALALAVVAGLSVVAAAGTQAKFVNVTGTYTSNWDSVTLTQDGDLVRGTYVCCGGGTIKGRIVEGRVIKFHWHEPRGAGDGEGIWTITRSGRLEGTWGHGQSESDGGPWNLVPKQSSQQRVTIAQ